MSHCIWLVASMSPYGIRYRYEKYLLFECFNLQKPYGCFLFLVRGWLDREEKRKYRVGQFWYLISRDWWITWLHYVSNSTTMCEYCKRASTQSTQRQSNSNCGIDEALVCDESFNSNSLESVGVDVAISSDNCSMGNYLLLFI